MNDQKLKYPNVLKQDTKKFKKLSTFDACYNITSNKIKLCSVCNKTVSQCNELVSKTLLKKLIKR